MQLCRVLRHIVLLFVALSGAARVAHLDGATGGTSSAPALPPTLEQHYTIDTLSTRDTRIDR